MVTGGDVGGLNVERGRVSVRMTGFDLLFFAVLPAGHYYVQNDEEGNDQKVDHQPGNAFDLQVAFVTLHEVTIVPMAGNAPGTHHLSA